MGFHIHIATTLRTWADAVAAPEPICKCCHDPPKLPREMPVCPHCTSLWGTTNSSGHVRKAVGAFLLPSATRTAPGVVPSVSKPQLAGPGRLWDQLSSVQHRCRPLVSLGFTSSALHLIKSPNAHRELKKPRHRGVLPNQEWQGRAGRELLVPPENYERLCPQHSPTPGGQCVRWPLATSRGGPRGVSVPSTVGPARTPPANGGSVEWLGRPPPVARHQGAAHPRQRALASR